MFSMSDFVIILFEKKLPPAGVNILKRPVVGLPTDGPFFEQKLEDEFTKHYQQII